MLFKVRKACNHCLLLMASNYGTAIRNAATRKCGSRIEAPVTDHLRDSPLDLERYEVV